MLLWVEGYIKYIPSCCCCTYPLLLIKLRETCFVDLIIWEVIAFKVKLIIRVHTSTVTHLVDCGVNEIDIKAYVFIELHHMMKHFLRPLW